MPSPDRQWQQISGDGRKALLEVAMHSIREGLRTGHGLRLDSKDYPEELQARRACFVTLNNGGDLRGCIGHLEAVQPLVCDVAENAFAAAFRDPRFPPLNDSEVDAVDLHISVLTPATPVDFTTEQDLLRKIRPGIDGLIIEEGGHRGTFLPAVWQSLPDPRDFLRHLKLKAGLPVDHWSKAIRISRYQTEAFSSAEIT